MEDPDPDTGIGGDGCDDECSKAHGPGVALELD
jgi:hypothetical protein